MCRLLAPCSTLRRIEEGAAEQQLYRRPVLWRQQLLARIQTRGQTTGCRLTGTAAAAAATTTTTMFMVPGAMHDARYATTYSAAAPLRAIAAYAAWRSELITALRLVFYAVGLTFRSLLDACNAVRPTGANAVRHARIRKNSSRFVKRHRPYRCFRQAHDSLARVLTALAQLAITALGPQVCTPFLSLLPFFLL